MAKAWGSWWAAERQERGQGRPAPCSLLSPAHCHPGTSSPVERPRGDGMCWVLASAGGGAEEGLPGALPCAILMATTGQASCSGEETEAPIGRRALARGGMRTARGGP